MKTWTAKLDIAFFLTEEEVKKRPDAFKDANNPTDEEVRAYFQDRLMNYAESNDGSELLANADFSVAMKYDAPANRPLVINDLTFDRVHKLLVDGGYTNEPYTTDYAKSIVTEKKFDVEGQFANGNRLVALEKRRAIFGVVDTNGNLLSAFFVYDSESVNYHPKSDTFLITAHETLTEAFDDGTTEVEHTR